MGIYDSLYVSCPRCHNTIEYQSKAGDCVLARYSVQNVPPDIAGDLDGEPASCKGCGSTVIIHTVCVVTPVLHIPVTDNIGGLDEEYWSGEDEDE